MPLVSHSWHIGAFTLSPLLVSRYHCIVCSPLTLAIIMQCVCALPDASNDLNGTWFCWIEVHCLDC